MKLKGLLLALLPVALLACCAPMMALAIADDGFTQTAPLVPASGVQSSGSLLLQARTYVSTLQNGAAPQEGEVSRIKAGDMGLTQEQIDGVTETLMTAMANLETFSVDFSEYGVNCMQFKALFAQTLNLNPEFYYVDRFDYSGGTLDHIGHVFLRYAEQEEDPRPAQEKVYEMTREMNAAIDDVLSWVPVDVPDEYKIKAVHDWLVRNVVYNTEAANMGYDAYTAEYGGNPWSAYGALVEKSAVCEGYALAMTMVLNQLGIESEYCYNNNHTWNYVRLVNNERVYVDDNGATVHDDTDSVWYHVDATWDDPIPDGGFGTTPSTKYFMKTNAYLRNLKDGTHDRWDSRASCWYCPYVDPKQAAVELPTSWPTYSGPVREASGKASVAEARKDLADAEVSPIPDQPYDPDGGWHPLVDVTLDGKKLSNANDYYLFYRDNEEVGQATVVICGRNEYKGERLATFNIVDDGIDMSKCEVAPVADQEYSGQEIKPELEVTYDVNASFGPLHLYEDSAYTATYSNNVNAGTATVTLTGKAGSSYSGTTKATFKIVPADINNDCVAVNPVPDQRYEGKAVTPVPTVSFQGKELKNGVDFELSYQDNDGVGTGTVAIQGKGNFTGRRTATFGIVDSGPSGSDPADSPEAASHDMHRLYNAWSGEHFYTSDDAEFAGLVELGWTDEGTGWTAPASSNTPVYRVYNPNAGEHHYTMDAAERDGLVDAGWTDEGVGWYSDDEQRTPLYREYNPYEYSNNHNYTTDSEEHAFLVGLGWVDEGYAWYGM